MKHIVYIDYMGSYDYEYKDDTCNQFVSRKLGVQARFVCNSYSKISVGDVFEIIFDSAEDATVFALTNDYTIIDKF